jgi:hypothetical protein
MDNSSSSSLPFAVNCFGHLPFNPDNLIDGYPRVGKRSYDRPVGLPFQDITKLYWTVRSFEVNFTIISFNAVNAFTSFVAGGFAAGGLLGASAGLATVTQSLTNEQPIIMAGHTKIIQKFQRTIRNRKTYSVPFEGTDLSDPSFYSSSSSSSSSSHPFSKDEDPQIQPNPKVSLTFKPNEGSLCSAGPVHKLQVGSSYLVIDFSDIWYNQNKWWPKMHFYGTSSNLAFSFNPIQSNVIVIGGVNFLGYLIPFYGFAESFLPIPLPPPVFAFGTIQPGKRHCDKFYWDGVDRTDPVIQEELQLSTKDRNDCNSIYANDKLTQSREKGTAEELIKAGVPVREGGGFVGGGGGFGGGGASATF